MERVKTTIEISSQHSTTSTLSATFSKMIVRFYPKTVQKWSHRIFLWEEQPHKCIKVMSEWLKSCKNSTMIEITTLWALETKVTTMGITTTKVKDLSQQEMLTISKIIIVWVVRCLKRLKAIIRNKFSRLSIAKFKTHSTCNSLLIMLRISISNTRITCSLLKVIPRETLLTIMMKVECLLIFTKSKGNSIRIITLTKMSPQAQFRTMIRILIWKTFFTNSNTWSRTNPLINWITTKGTNNQSIVLIASNRILTSQIWERALIQQVQELWKTSPHQAHRTRRSQIWANRRKLYREKRTRIST